MNSMHLRQKLAFATMAVVLTTGGVATTSALANSEGVNVSAANYENYSVEQLETLIGKLQARVAELKKGSKCFVSEKNISLGDGEPGDGYDGDVRRLQAFLKEKGTFKVSSTGYFGKITRSALQSYQKSVGVEATGEFDGATREKAHGSYCKVALKKDVKMEKKAEMQKAISTGEVRGIYLKVTEGVAVWKVDGYSAKGFKVVWSKNAGPTYPTRDGDTYAYLSEPSATESKIEPFSGSGTYYVRVCEYLGGACGLYSNEVFVSL